MPPRARLRTGFHVLGQAKLVSLIGLNGSSPLLTGSSRYIKCYSMKNQPQLNSAWQKNTQITDIK